MTCRLMLREAFQNVLHSGLGLYGIVVNLPRLGLIIVLYHTVDGRNPANPVDMYNLVINNISNFHYLEGLTHPWWCRISSINSII